jgi:hypothetical protein
MSRVVLPTRDNTPFLRKICILQLFFILLVASIACQFPSIHPSLRMYHRGVYSTQFITGLFNTGASNFLSNWTKIPGDLDRDLKTFYCCRRQNSGQNFFCVTLIVFKLLTATCISRIHTICTATFPLQQLSCESDTLG